MRIVSKHQFSQEQQNEIKEAVLKQIKPNVLSKSNMTVKIPGFTLTGSYLLGRRGNFTVYTVEKTDGATPKPKNPKKSETKKPTQAEQRKELMKLKKDELIGLCKKHKIKHESDNNKATLVDLLMLNGKSE